MSVPPAIRRRRSGSVTAALTEPKPSRTWGMTLARSFGTAKAMMTPSTITTSARTSSLSAGALGEHRGERPLRHCPDSRDPQLLHVPNVHRDLAGIPWNRQTDERQGVAELDRRPDRNRAGHQSGEHYPLADVGHLSQHEGYDDPRPLCIRDLVGDGVETDVGQRADQGVGGDERQHDHREVAPAHALHLDELELFGADRLGRWPAQVLDLQLVAFRVRLKLARQHGALKQWEDLCESIVATSICAMSAARDCGSVEA
jgi:hypothetical protein